MIFRFRSSNASTTPFTSGNSGPTTVKSGCNRSASASSRGISPASADTHSTSSAIPPFPGAHHTFSTSGLAPSFHTSACSRPPPPITRTFIEFSPRNSSSSNHSFGPNHCQLNARGYYFIPYCEYTSLSPPVLCASRVSAPPPLTLGEHPGILSSGDDRAYPIASRKHAWPAVALHHLRPDWPEHPHLCVYLWHHEERSPTPPPGPSQSPYAGRPPSRSANVSSRHRLCREREKTAWG